MSLQTGVRGIIPHTKSGKNMQIIYDTCIQEGISVPFAVMKYFENSEEVNEEGVAIDISDAVVRKGNHGIIVHKALIPEDVKIIEFYTF